MRAGAALAALIALAAPPAGAIELSLPVDCRPGETCFIQNYVDRDPGPGATDHDCGTLSYDGHKGTDFRLKDRAAMCAGVDVLAAAPGIVTGTRDGMADIARGEPGAPDLAGRDCGNGVMLRHEGGWTTQYCHLGRGSVAVARGQRVARGTRLGRIGLSGNTDYPHLHLTVRDPQGRVIDPFDAREQGQSCRFPETDRLWAAEVALPYRGGGALAAGFADAVPDYGAVRDGTAHAGRLARSAPAIVFWAHFYGLRQGDRIVTRLTAPDGAIAAEDRHEMDRARATQFRAVGRRSDGALAAGVWRGTAALIRDGAVHDRIEAETRVE